MCFVVNLVHNKLKTWNNMELCTKAISIWWSNTSRTLDVIHCQNETPQFRNWVVFSLFSCMVAFFVCNPIQWKCILHLWLSHIHKCQPLKIKPPHAMANGRLKKCGYIHQHNKNRTRKNEEPKQKSKKKIHKHKSIDLDLWCQNKIQCIHRCTPAQINGVLFVVLRHTHTKRTETERIRFTCESFPIHLRVVFSVLWIILNAANKVSFLSTSFFSISFPSVVPSFVALRATDTDTRNSISNSCIHFWLVGCGYEYFEKGTLLETNKTFPLSCNCESFGNLMQQIQHRFNERTHTQWMHTYKNMIGSVWLRMMPSHTPAHTTGDCVWASVCYNTMSSMNKPRMSKAESATKNNGWKFATTRKTMRIYFGFM